jgi:hypothetical protein
MSVSPASDPMESLFTLSSAEQRAFTLDAPPRPSDTIGAPTPRDLTVDADPDIEATTVDSEDGKKTGGEGILEVVAEGTPDILEFVFSDVFGNLLEWLG